MEKTGLEGWGNDLKLIKLNTLIEQYWYTVADPAAEKWGPRNMNCMWPPLVVIFFYDLFLQGREEHGPRALPPNPLLGIVVFN